MLKQSTLWDAEIAPTTDDIQHPSSSAVPTPAQSYEYRRCCMLCHEFKRRSEFPMRYQNGKPWKRHTQCRTCINKKTLAWNKAHATPEKAQRVNLKSQYGLTPEDVAVMLDQQDGCCALCGDRPGPLENGWYKTGHFRESGLVIDHDHTTGAVRGMVCSNCNTGLGLLKEDPERLRRAIAYIQRCSEYVHAITV